MTQLFSPNVAVRPSPEYPDLYEVWVFHTNKRERIGYIRRITEDEKRVLAPPESEPIYFLPNQEHLSYDQVTVIVQAFRHFEKDQN